MDDTAATCPNCHEPTTGMRADLGSVRNWDSPIRPNSFTQTYQPCGCVLTWQRRIIERYELVT